jgi:glycosyltransferase involved in cell wall biosynthesis
MKVLMFGWEFPPHISGGLGTACYGLTRGLSTLEEMEILFVVPKTHGDEDKGVATLIGAEDISVRQQTVEYHSKWKELDRQTIKKLWEQAGRSTYDEVANKIKYVEVDSNISPYLSPEEFDKEIEERKLREKLTREDKLHLQKMTAKQLEQVNIKNLIDDHNYKFSFSGKYGKNLLQEVADYAIVGYQIAKNNEFDLIHSHDWLTYHAGIAAKKASGKPLVIHVHATEFDRSGENVNPKVFAIERMGMEAADKIITVSNLTKKIVVEKYGINPNKITTVYNAVEPQKDETKKQYKKTVDEKIVTFLGRITFQKGPDYFIEAAYKVLQRTDNVRFVMAGSGDLLRKMIRRAAKLGIMDKFHFTDFLKGEDVNRMLALSDVYVMPSVSEPFGISPLEAMRSNVPVIISKQSGVAEILEHAIKIDFWDVDAMADSIYGLLNYDALAEMFARFGKSEVDMLKWENAAINVKNVYASALV